MLTTPDMQASVAFYRDICGFELEESWPEGDSPIWANMNLDGQSVMIGAPMDPAQVEGMCKDEPKEMAWHMEIANEFPANKAGVGAYFYLMVDDVDAFHAEVIARRPTCHRSQDAVLRSACFRHSRSQRLSPVVLFATGYGKLRQLRHAFDRCQRR